jgi:protein TonB
MVRRTGETATPYRSLDVDHDRRRTRWASASVALHLGVVAVLLWWPNAPLPLIAPTPALMTFDVAPPPPEPLPEIAPPESVKLPPDAATTRNDDPGGASAGRFSPRDTRVTRAPAPMPEVPRPPARLDDAPIRAAPITADGFATALQPAADSIAGLGAAAMGAGIGTSAGAGAGTGQGDVSGAGRGRGRPVRARWVRMPTNLEMKPYWPEAARAAKLSGKAILECVVPKIGPPKSCRAIAETPAGSGFAQAAVRMSPIFRIVPVTRAGRVEDMPIIVPVAFAYTGR